MAAKSDREIMRQNAANMEHAYRNLLSEICTGIGDVALELKDLEKSETQAAKAIATLNDMVDKIETALFGKEQ